MTKEMISFQFANFPNFPSNDLIDLGKFRFAMKASTEIALIQPFRLKTYLFRAVLTIPLIIRLQ